MGILNDLITFYYLLLSTQRSVPGIGEPSDGHAYNQGDDENMFCDKKGCIR